MLSQPQFIGRGEVLSQKILWKFLDCEEIYEQVNITKVIPISFMLNMDQEILNHNFDFLIHRTIKKDIVVEVNYKHKEKAARKWRQIFVPLLQEAGYEFITIDDYDCRKKGLFYLNSKKEHELSWDDYRDVIDALEKSGVKP